MEAHTQPCSPLSLSPSMAERAEMVLHSEKTLISATELGEIFSIFGCSMLIFYCLKTSSGQGKKVSWAWLVGGGVLHEMHEVALCQQPGHTSLHRHCTAWVRQGQEGLTRAT